MVAFSWTLQGKIPVVVVAPGDVTEDPGKAAGVGFTVSGDSSVPRINYKGNTLWLLTFKPCHLTAGDGGGDLTLPSCDDLMFTVPQAYKNASMNYGAEDMIKSAYDGWVANGKVNPFDIPQSDPTSTALLPYFGGLASPGFFNFSTCDVVTMHNNWNKFPDTKTPPAGFPCN